MYSRARSLSVTLQYNMNKLIVALIAVILFTGSSMAEVKTLSPIDKIIAIVNGEIITQGDIDLYLSGAQNEDRGRQAQFAMAQLINSILIRQKAKELGIVFSSAEIEKRVEAASETIDMPDRIIRRWIEEDEIKRVIRHELIAPRVSVSPGEVQDYYRVHIDNFREPARVLIRDISIKYFPDEAIKSGIEDIRSRLNEVAALASDTAAIAKIEAFNEKVLTLRNDPGQMLGEINILLETLMESEDPLVQRESTKLHEKYEYFKTEEQALEIGQKILEELQNGADFETLVIENSEGPYRNNGGKWEWFARDELASKLDVIAEKAFSMSELEISDIIEASNTKYIIQKIGDKPASIQEVEDPEVQELIMQRIRSQLEEEEEIKFWKELREAAYIQLID